MEGDFEDVDDENVDAAGRIPTIDAAVAKAPTVPFPAHPAHSFRYEVIQNHCGLPNYAKKGHDRKYAYRKREIVEAVRANLMNGTLMVGLFRFLFLFVPGRLNALCRFMILPALVA